MDLGGRYEICGSGKRPEPANVISSSDLENRCETILNSKVLRQIGRIIYNFLPLDDEKNTIAW